MREKRGRAGPKFAKGEAKGERVQFRAQPEEVRLFEKQAAKQKLTVSEWIRLLKQASESGG